MKSRIIRMLITLGFLLSFILLISWTVEFQFLGLEDIKLFFILLLSSIILVTIGHTDFSDKVILMKKIRLNVFFTGMLMSIMTLFEYMTSSIYQMDIGLMIMSLKPIIFAMIINLPVKNIVESLPVKEDKPDVRLLSRREDEVFRFIMKGKTNKEISEALYIAENTVKKHVQNILKKLECSDRQDLIHSFKKTQ